MYGIYDQDQDSFQYLHGIWNPESGWGLDNLYGIGNKSRWEKLLSFVYILVKENRLAWNWVGLGSGFLALKYTL